mmetsp:Transcript_24096/g.67512  ORF Transcript_24096/g.67512 Transcript_24096/m.67512 type:complete len:571 (+) Transcript_24096:194-1906(+)
METELFPSLGMGEGSHNLRLSDAFGTDSVMYMFDEPGVEETGGSGSPSSLLVSTSDFSSESSPAFVPDGPCPTLAPYAADAGLETGTGLDDVVVSPVSVTVTPRTSPAPDASPVSSHVTARLAQMSNPFAVKRETPTPRSAKERRAVLSATRKRKRELQRRGPPPRAAPGGGGRPPAAPAPHPRHRQGPDAAGPRREAHRRAVGLRGPVPGGLLPALGRVGGVERALPRRRAGVPQGRRRQEGRLRHAARRQRRPVPHLRPQAAPQYQLRHRARRVHPQGPRDVQPQAQRRQRRGRPRRVGRQRVVELRPRGQGRGAARRGPPRAADAQLPPRSHAVPRHAHGADGRRVRADHGGQQQHLRPRQPAHVVRLGHRPRLHRRGLGRVLPVLLGGHQVPQGPPPARALRVPAPRGHHLARNPLGQPGEQVPGLHAARPGRRRRQPGRQPVRRLQRARVLRGGHVAAAAAGAGLAPDGGHQPRDAQGLPARRPPQDRRRRVQRGALLLRFAGRAIKIHFFSIVAEFVRVRWLEWSQLLEGIVAFKRPVYDQPHELAKPAIQEHLMGRGGEPGAR